MYRVPVFEKVRIRLLDNTQSDMTMRPELRTCDLYGMPRFGFQYFFFRFRYRVDATPVDAARVLDRYFLIQVVMGATTRDLRSASGAIGDAHRMPAVDNRTIPTHVFSVLEN